MTSLEKYNAVDITQKVVDARDALGIPSQIVIGGVTYPVYPPKQVVVFAQPEHLSQFVVDRWLQAAIDSTEGHIIPTGATYEPVYAEAARRKNVLTPLLERRYLSNLDEVWPIRKGDPNLPLTYRVYRNEKVVKPLGLSQGQCIIPDGTTKHLEQEVANFEARLARRKWDFAMMGIGPDEKVIEGRRISASPHIGFIPRGTLPTQTAMFVELDEGTVFANSRSAPDPDHFFTHAITQGPGDIRRAEKHILVATGQYKPRNIRNVLLGPVDLAIPATQVLLYPDTTVVLDQQSALLVQAGIENFSQR